MGPTHNKIHNKEHPKIINSLCVRLRPKRWQDCGLCTVYCVLCTVYCGLCTVDSWLRSSGVGVVRGEVMDISTYDYEHRFKN